jgi:hypothetical protein
MASAARKSTLASDVSHRIRTADYSRICCCSCIGLGLACYRQKPHRPGLAHCTRPIWSSDRGLEVVSIWLANHRMHRNRIRALRQPERINLVCGIVGDVRIEIRPAAVFPDRVLVDEPANRGIVVSGSVLIDSGLGIELASVVLERICDCPTSGSQLAVAVIRLLTVSRSRWENPDLCPGRPTHRSDVYITNILKIVKT